jgi:hypothetical protein
LRPVSWYLPVLGIKRKTILSKQNAGQAIILCLLMAIIISSPTLLNLNPVRAQTIVETDTIPPDTRITSATDGNGKPVQSGGTTTSNNIRFTFTGTDNAGGVSTYQCSIDSHPYTTCGSGINYPSLGAGSHSFSVSAVDSEGNLDPSPAVFGWAVQVNDLSSQSSTDVPLSAADSTEPSASSKGQTHTSKISNQQISALSSNPCSVDICVNPGEIATTGFTCTNDDPRAIVTCAMLSGPPGATFSSTTGNPAFGAFTWANAGPSGTYQASFQAQTVFCPPDITCTPSDVLTITILVNHPPVANTGPDQTVTAGETVTLNGAGSSDLDGDSLTYSWSQTAGPDVSFDFTAPNPAFTAPEVDTETTLTFQLIVNDGSLDSEPATVNIIINPISDCTCGTAPTSLAVSSEANECNSEDKKAMTILNIGADPYTVQAKSLAEVKFIKSYKGVPMEGYGGMTYVDIQAQGLPKKGDFVTCEGKTTITVTITVVIPEWASGSLSRLSPDAQAEWKRFHDAVLEHENGHVAGARNFFEGIGEKLIDKNRDEAVNAIEEAKRNYRIFVADPYDASTGHGASQGAVLNTNVK